MRKFSFRLETLLHVRELAKDKAIAEYGKAISIRQKCEERLSAEIHKLENLKKQVKENRVSGFFAHLQSPFGLSIQTTKDRIILLKKEVVDSGNIEEDKRKNYKIADSSFKSMLKLKSNQKTEHFKSELRKDEIELEDIINSRFVYKKFTQ